MGSDSGIITYGRDCFVLVSLFPVVLLPVCVTAHPAIHGNVWNRAM